jgi:uncharacterized membrane protein
MPAVTESIHVHRSAEEVWAYLTDWSRYPEWDSTTAGAEQIDPGEPQPGTRFRWVGKVPGRTLPFQSVVTEWDPPRRMAYASTSGLGPLTGSAGWKTVTAAAGGCVVEVGVDVSVGLPQPLRLVVDPLVPLLLRGRMRRDLRRLRTVLHGEAPAGDKAVPTSVETVHVNRDPQEVWDYLTDLSHQPEWDTLTISCEQIDEGPMQVGTRFRWVLRLMGRRIAIESHLTGWSPPKQMEYAVTTGPVQGAGWTAVFPSAGGGCDVERGVVAAPGVGRAVARVSDPVLVWWTGRSERKAMRRLADILGHASR